MKRVFGVGVGAAILAWILLRLAGEGTFGAPLTAGDVHPEPLAPELVAARDARSSAAQRGVGAPARKTILFGDLHVHSSFSVDAFQLTLPMSGGDGAHPVADACDFARFCSNLSLIHI